jgi:4-diphosphocytidyl-2-C-methyl-D-erythritol kinase
MAASAALSDPAWQRRWPAPAKLNLFLHVVGRRADGYHLLQTAFRLIDLCDSLEFAPRADGAIRLATPLSGVPEGEDLTVRAARLLREAAGLDAGVEIRLEKRIPIGGGLGGGSSDAATTLIALNDLWGAGLGRCQLAALALRLGADVPFFLLGRNALGEGIGERLTALDLDPAWYVVITPQVAVSTREIFASPALTRDTKPLKLTAFFAGLGHNDLEPVVCARVPQVAQTLRWLRVDAGRADARMSGSGSSVFATFGSESEARALVDKIPRNWRGVAVRGLDRHPLALEIEAGGTEAG